MESLIYPVVLNNLRQTLMKLSTHYNVELVETNNLLEQCQIQYQPALTNSNIYPRCQARIWNGGISDQCHRKSGQGIPYCRYHGMPTQLPLCIKCTEYYKKNCYHNYQWEHFGNINESLPDFFRT
jgi:hypothetical protein